MKPVHLIFIGLILFASGCATVIKGRYQLVSFSSTPEAATVTLNGRTLGQTPLTIELKKSTGQEVVFEKEGYKPLAMKLETRTSNWFWANLFPGILIFGVGACGSATDAVTGAVYEYSPSQYLVTLQPVSYNQVTDAPKKTQKDRIREFIVIGYSSLRADLNAGSGQYLSSLLELLNVKDDKRATAIIRLKVLAETNPNIMDFADQVIASFVEEK